jgi:probable rRNA maturation factor
MNPTASVLVRNRQRAQKLDLRLLRRMVRTLCAEVLARAAVDVGIQIVGSAEIIRLNEAFLRHQGATDVITFSYAEPGSGALHGEIFVCLPEAFSQARCFRTTWQQELARYVVHGVLHLCGYDDQTPATRRRMKRAEDAALRQLAVQYCFQELGGSAPRSDGGISRRRHRRLPSEPAPGKPRHG